MCLLYPLLIQLGQGCKYIISLPFTLILHSEWAGYTKSASIALACIGALHCSPAKHNYIISNNKHARPDSRNLADMPISYKMHALKFL